MMSQRAVRRTHLCVASVVSLLAFAGCHRVTINPNPIPGEPRVILWAWQKPSDLRFIDPRTTGVSLLIKSIWLTHEGIWVDPNLNTISYPAGTWLMACARMEIQPSPKPEFSAAQAEAAAAEIAAMAQIPNIRAVQIDFDATLSQRPFYRQLLAALRRRLPSPYPISMTALASWCAGDDWLRELPVQEAVPMLFRMGPNQSFAAFAAAGKTFREPLCRSSVGIADDEPLHVPDHKRLYLFANRGWSPDSFGAIMAVAGH